MAASIHDAKLEQTLAPIVGRIVAASDRPDQPYRITILNAPAINAFALPGGYLYVTRGLLALANDSSEVAAVLAHEMAHVTANHAIERQNKARNAMIVSRVVTDVLDDDEPASWRWPPASGRSPPSRASRNSRPTPSASRPSAGPATIPSPPPASSTRWRATPPTASRLTLQDKRPDFLASASLDAGARRLRHKAARQFGAPGVGAVDRDRYLAGIDGMVFGDDPSQGFVRDRTFVHPGLGVGFTVPEGFVIDNTSDAVLATGVDGTALRFDAVGLARGARSCRLSRLGLGQRARRGERQSFSVNGLQAASAMAAAKGWQFRIAVVQAPAATPPTASSSPTRSVRRASTRRRARRSTSFRKLSPSELASFKPLHIHIVTVGPGDTEASWSGA